jgi:hypothetical protein
VVVAALHDQRTKATFVILRAPAAGRWTLSSQAGSASITGVHSATSLPPVSVKARVAGTGRRRLIYGIARIPGQTVRFLERGAKSPSVIGQVNTGGRGTIRLAPGPARQASHRSSSSADDHAPSSTSRAMARLDPGDWRDPRACARREPAAR